MPKFNLRLFETFILDFEFIPNIESRISLPIIGNTNLFIQTK